MIIEIRSTMLTFCYHDMDIASQLTLAASQPLGCYRLHPPLPFNSKTGTRFENLYSLCHGNIIEKEQ